MHALRLARTFPLCLALVTAAGSARAEVIDVGGSTPDYDDIQAAVDAAVDGDILRIAPGNWSHFHIEDKSLTLVSSVPGTYFTVNGAV